VFAKRQMIGHSVEVAPRPPSGVTPAEVEADLRGDRAAIPGAIEQWDSQASRKRRLWLRRFVRGEHRRHEFESVLAADPAALASWHDFPKTEQREVLSTIDHWRLWPVSWEMRRAARAVRSGSSYRRLYNT
jgi:hypothetical protein